MHVRNILYHHILHIFCICTYLVAHDFVCDIYRKTSLFAEYSLHYYIESYREIHNVQLNDLLFSAARSDIIKYKSDDLS